MILYNVFSIYPLVGQNILRHRRSNVRFMALMFGQADRETYGNAIGLLLTQLQVIFPLPYLQVIFPLLSGSFYFGIG